MSEQRTVVLGGGLSGMAAAYALARAGQRVTLVERGAELGGLAGTFESQGRFYPLAYHHILHRDSTLLMFLDRIGALPEVRWRKINMLFQLNGRFYNLARPLDFARFPMSVADKLRFVRLMLRSFNKADWQDWHDRSAAELVDTWGGAGVREGIFERLSRLKFDLPCDEVSGAWLGARLHYREGSAPLGYIPGGNWTKVLCEGVARLLQEQDVQLRMQTSVDRLEVCGDSIVSAELGSGESLPADRFVSTVPTEVYRQFVPGDDTPGIESVRYTAIVSAICATRQPLAPDFYWMNLASLDCEASGIFRLESLNPTIGSPGDTCINFVTHVSHRDHPFFSRSEEELMRGYLADFRRVFGFALEPFWSRLIRLPMYSPVFHKGYRNPPARSESWRNLYFAGNYRTFPSIASTGTALLSGLEAAQAILGEFGEQTDLLPAAQDYRLGAMPRG